LPFYDLWPENRAGLFSKKKVSTIKDVDKQGKISKEKRK